MDSYGTENTKKLIKEIGETIYKWNKAREDGDVTLMEKITMAPQLVRLIGAGLKYELVYKEWLDLDAEEVDEVNAYFREKFDLLNDNAEEVIEQIFEILLNIDDLLLLLGINLPEPK